MKMRWRPWYRELGDQLLHALWAGASVAAIVCAFPPSWLEMQMWQPGLFAAGTTSLGVLAVREVMQYPPAEDRPWDFVLDCGGYALGAAVALGVLL